MPEPTVTTYPCPVCDGTGRQPYADAREPCEACGGSGECTDRETRVGECEWLVEELEGPQVELLEESDGE